MNFLNLVIAQVFSRRLLIGLISYIINVTPAPLTLIANNQSKVQGSANPAHEISYTFRIGENMGSKLLYESFEEKLEKAGDKWLSLQCFTISGYWNDWRL